MGLIDDLAEKVGCECISELRFHPEQYSLYRAVSSMPVDLYGEHEWQQAAFYFMPGADLPCDGEACKERLLAHLLPKTP